MNGLQTRLLKNDARESVNADILRRYQNQLDFSHNITELTKIKYKTVESYCMFLILNVDAPWARMFLAVICRPPLARVFSETSKLPMSMGSILGISNSGIPLTSDGRSFSILVTIHAFKSGSLLWQMCNTSARQRRKCSKRKIKRFRYDFFQDN